jgi:hypothetical protein
MNSAAPSASCQRPMDRKPPIGRYGRRRCFWASSAYCVGDFGSSSLMTELMPGKYVRRSRPRRIGERPFLVMAETSWSKLSSARWVPKIFYSISLFLRGEPALISR